MKSNNLSLIAALAALTLAAPADEELSKRATPKVYLAGDSTMAKASAGSGIEGWGVYLPYSLTGVTVINNAIGGRSARSYTDEGRFNTIINAVVAGDYVVIEFGHNDGGSLSPVDNGRSACVGAGSETCVSASGAIVQTYPTYLTNAAKALVAKGARVIISSPTPNNVCEGTTCTYTPSRFTGYCKIVVSNTGSSANFVDHGQYVANEYIRLGKTTVDTYYPNDHTHTSPAGAEVVAKQFVKGLLCGGSPLAAYVKNGTSSIPGNCI
ncbi:SGNH hydrolase [Bisporella sp. PMI_857]|nr:SGNH hydrolase [Bisporella sp. PMI_857]